MQMLNKHLQRKFTHIDIEKHLKNAKILFFA